MDGSVEGDTPELSYSPIVVAVYLVWVLISLLHSHWSNFDDVLLSLVEMVDYVALPALVCHKEPAQGTQNLPGTFIVFRWFFVA